MCWCWVLEAPWLACTLCICVAQSGKIRCGGSGVIEHASMAQALSIKLDWGFRLAKNSWFGGLAL